MSKFSELEIGKTYYPKKQEVIVTDEKISGPGWKVENSTGCYVFEFLASRHGGGVDRYELSEEEFYQVKRGELTFDDLLELTDRNPKRFPIT